LSLFPSPMRSARELARDGTLPPAVRIGPFDIL
jgi:hypothetical protein